MATTGWITGSGTWTSAGNWSAGVPGSADLAIFNDFLGMAAFYAADPTRRVPGIGETVSGAGQAGTLVVDDPVSFTGSIADAVGIIQATATTSAGAAKPDPAPDVVLNGAGAAWSSSIGLILGAGTSLTLEGGAALAVGAAGVTAQAGATLTLEGGGTVSGPVVLAGGTLQAFGAAALGGPVLVSGTGTVLADTLNRNVLAITGAVSGGALVAGQVTPLPPGSLFAGVQDSAVGTLRLSGADSLPGGITVVYSETLELASAGASGGGPIAVQQDAALVVDAGATVAGPITVVAAPARGNIATITNADASLLVFESDSGTSTAASGPPTVTFTSMRFMNGAGHSTVVGANTDAAGSGTIMGGTGSVTVFGGRNYVVGGSAGNNLIVSTVGDPSVGSGFGTIYGQTIGGGGSGDLLLGDSGGDLVVAGAGNETLSSAGETQAPYGFDHGAQLFGSTGADVLVAGGLQDTVVAGSGPATLFGGSGHGILDAGSGADLIVTGSGGDFVQAGAGAATVYAALGANTLVVLNGHAGGTEVVRGFKVGTDVLALRGYAGTGTQAGVTSSQVVAGSTLLTLADNTRVTLVGVGNLGAASFT